MKKLFVAAFLSLLLLPLNTGKASAWSWPWSCCGHCYNFSICCKQYNAFSPVCFGKLYCDGCCPSPYLNGYGHSPAHGNCLPMLGSSSGEGGQFLGQLPTPEEVAPPTFDAPMPLPADGPAPGAGGSSMRMPAGTPNIQSTGYGIYPTRYAVPTYYPTGMPNYWYGSGGY